MASKHEVGDASRVLDGDLDGFIHKGLASLREGDQEATEV